MLTLDQKALIKYQIVKKIKRVSLDIESLKETTKPISPENAIGRVSRMDAINNKSVAEESLRKAIDKLAKLNEALSNIYHEDFGLCQKCKSEIEYKRIELMPEMRRCMKCAT